MARHAGTARRGWKGNALGLHRVEVLGCHDARLDATEAVAVEMRKGRTFDQAKAIIEKRAAAVYRHRQPAFYKGTMACVQNVQFGDMPKDITNKIGDEWIASIERDRGRKMGKVERWWFRLTGLTF